MDDNNQKETVQGYEIQRSVIFEDNRGFAIAHNPNAPDPYVTWQFTQDDNGVRDYYWGRYTSSLESATMNYENRVTTYMLDNGLSLSDSICSYKYYSTQRPIDIATYPKPIENTPLQIVNFDERDKVEYERFLAWGYLVYDSPLTEKQIDDYELRPSPDNADVRAKMTEQAQVVGHWEDMKGLHRDERFTWHKPSIHAFELCYPPVSPERMAERFRRAKHELTRDDRQTAKKPIMEQLAEAAKKVEHNTAQATDRKLKREER